MKSLSSGIERLLELGEEKGSGCGRCQFGVIDPEPVVNVADGRLAQFKAGRLQICDCVDGERLRACMMKRAAMPDVAVQQQMDIAAAKSKRKDKLFAQAGVPPRFAEYTLRGYRAATRGDVGKQGAIDAIMAHYAGAAEKPGILLCGPTGTGKTGALSPLFLHYMDQGYGGLWLPYFEMMADFRDFGGGKVAEKIEVAQVIDYLFIDDMGDPKRKESTDYEREVMFRLIDHRNNYKMATFITSNLSVERLSDYYRPELTKRLHEACTVVPVTGKQLGQETTR